MYLILFLFFCIAIDLIKKLLTVDPKKRITVEEALQHPWISVSFCIFYSKHIYSKNIFPIKNNFISVSNAFSTVVSIGLLHFQLRRVSIQWLFKTSR